MDLSPQWPRKQVSSLFLGRDQTGQPRWLSGKEATCNAGAAEDKGSVPGSGRSPGAGNGNPLQYSCLENPMNRGAWWVTVQRVPKSRIQLNTNVLHTETKVWNRRDAGQSSEPTGQARSKPRLLILSYRGGT